MLAIVLLLVTIGGLMVFSATWDWSNQTYGTASGFFVEEHLRNVILSTIALFFFATLDYRFWKRFAIWMLLITIIALVAGKNVRRVEVRRAAFVFRRPLCSRVNWLNLRWCYIWLPGWARNKLASTAFYFGLLPFPGRRGRDFGLNHVIQPDLSSAGIVALTAGVMFFVAGANLFHMLAVGGISTAVGIIVVNSIGPMLRDRIANFLAGLSDITLTDYHTLQAITAFVRGGWIGVGVGQSQQKFGALAGAAYRQYLRHRRRGAWRSGRGGGCRPCISPLLSAASRWRG